MAVLRRVRDVNSGIVLIIRNYQRPLGGRKLTMLPSSAYLFLELSLLVFLLGFGWEEWKLKDLTSRVFWLPAVCLACFWFVIDQIAIRLDLWAFPKTGTLPIQIFSLPVEEYVLFFLHTLVCFIFLKHYSRMNDK
jgi:lycopene cyclase domain-containing protein